MQREMLNSGGSLNSANANDEPIVIGHREQLFHLLAEACEIEHTLMCSYLYAAFSIKTNPPATE
jgi:hypothetical protein